MESVAVVIDRIMAVADDFHVSQNRRDVGHPRKLTRKQRGEMAEAAFVVKVAGMGYEVSKPWGESSRYDLVVDVGGRLVRVQVKSAHRAGEYGGYTFHAHGNSYRVYRASEIDVLVAYVVPEDAWYVFPVAVSLHALRGKSTASPHSEVEFQNLWGRLGFP